MIYVFALLIVEVLRIRNIRRGYKYCKGGSLKLTIGIIRFILCVSSSEYCIAIASAAFQFANALPCAQPYP